MRLARISRNRVAVGRVAIGRVAGMRVSGAHVAGTPSAIVFGVGAAAGAVLMLSGYVMTGAFVMLGGMLGGSLVERSTNA